MCPDQKPNQRPWALQDDAQPTEPRRPGPNFLSLWNLLPDFMFAFRESQDSLGFKGSEYYREQVGLSKTHFYCPRPDAGFWFGGLNSPLPVTWRETHVASDQEPLVLSLSEGKCICHSYCRDLVHLDYPQNGKLPTCLPTREVRLSSQKYTQVGTTGRLQSSGFQVLPSPTCPYNGLLTFMVYLCTFTGSCSFLAITLFPEPVTLELTYALGCDFVNNTILCTDGNPTDLG